MLLNIFAENTINKSVINGLLVLNPFKKSYWPQTFQWTWTWFNNAHSKYTHTHTHTHTHAQSIPISKIHLMHEWIIQSSLMICYRIRHFYLSHEWANVKIFCEFSEDVKIAYRPLLWCSFTFIILRKVAKIFIKLIFVPWHKVSCVWNDIREKKWWPNCHIWDLYLVSLSQSPSMASGRTALSVWHWLLPGRFGPNAPQADSVAVSG